MTWCDTGKLANVLFVAAPNFVVLALIIKKVAPSTSLPLSAVLYLVPLEQVVLKGTQRQRDPNE